MMKTTLKISLLLLVVNNMLILGQDQKLETETAKNLKYLLEEEKLARDVYTYLDEKWELRVFHNIKQSEQRHMDVLRNLLDANRIEFEISDSKGTFTNKELQSLYDEFISKGSISRQEAFKVGILIEEKDIQDLKAALSQTNNGYAQMVFSNLIRASNNHLRAFKRQLSR
ncbi:DUF2202 domain-containing protein [Sungkyunkwania multivorans]|uniref:DUF2202 domain-containing protein n=1 Tax=Sungkyunkwania multivorans TaxID=1173618 RepID=A0ABW3D1D7_9FLAO